MVGVVTDFPSGLSSHSVFPLALPYLEGPSATPCPFPCDRLSSLSSLLSFFLFFPSHPSFPPSPFLVFWFRASSSEILRKLLSCSDDELASHLHENTYPKTVSGRIVQLVRTYRVEELSGQDVSLAIKPEIQTYYYSSDLPESRSCLLSLVRLLRTRVGREQLYRTYGHPTLRKRPWPTMDGFPYRDDRLRQEKLQGSVIIRHSAATTLINLYGI